LSESAIIESIPNCLTDSLRCCRYCEKFVCTHPNTPFANEQPTTPFSQHLRKRTARTKQRHRHIRGRRFADCKKDCTGTAPETYRLPSGPGVVWAACFEELPRGVEPHFRPQAESSGALPPLWSLAARGDSHEGLAKELAGRGLGFRVIRLVRAHSSCRIASRGGGPPLGLAQLP
jgi:hypothetical protein